MLWCNGDTGLELGSNVYLSARKKDAYECCDTEGFADAVIFVRLRICQTAYLMLSDIHVDTNRYSFTDHKIWKQ